MVMITMTIMTMMIIMIMASLVSEILLFPFSFKFAF